ncbi:hypothetical protein [Catalinimonas niigatensis]|uniref:hypothetical protein n=1 Tax=Catalinimonas niigatensis TaxID=1397264 RepID=UPI002665271B|nr:hypothetical protein [Catalinimonas niigatensis]WPP49564.1 hypothetical protein PZB72_23100 [Catalinimonas niigatensis]
MPHDLLVEKAITLRDTLAKLEYELKASQYEPTLKNTYLLQQLDYACKTCVALGYQWVLAHDVLSNKNELAIFQKLVETKVIDIALSKRLLSLIAFRKLIREASLIKGKNIYLKITSRHLEDFHTFTQNVLLA